MENENGFLTDRERCIRAYEDDRYDRAVQLCSSTEESNRTTGEVMQHCDYRYLDLS
jgi:hypothetical protein